MAGAMPQYYLVKESVLPEVFLKVVQAKRLVARGQAASYSEAARMVGISRSAFYKYKDAVHLYEEDASRRVATLYVELVDEAGVLSSLLTALGRHRANIITINQNIPVDGVAPVSVSMHLDSASLPVEELLHELQNLYGVVTLKLLSAG